MPEEDNQLARDVRDFLKLIGKVESSSESAGLEAGFRTVLVRFVGHALDSYDFHHMNEEISKGHLDPKYIPLVKNALITSSATPWPDELKKIASSLEGDLKKLHEALLRKDKQAAAIFSHEVHEKGHQLSHSASEWLAKSR